MVQIFGGDNNKKMKITDTDFYYYGYTRDAEYEIRVDSGNKKWEAIHLTGRKLKANSLEQLKTFIGVDRKRSTEK